MQPAPLKRFEICQSAGNPLYIVAAGDVYLRRSRAAGALGPGVLQILQDKSLSLVNYECPVYDGSRPASKSGANLASSQQAIELLEIGHVDVATLANNHIMDFGGEGLASTVAACRRSGVAVVGAGRDLAAASEPLLVGVGDLRVAVLAFAQEEFNTAGPACPGTAPLEAVGVSRAIRRAKAMADLVIVSVHGGVEFYPIPTPRIQALYRFMAECGADAVLGHHPHIFQGIELYDHVPIVYSAGNFIAEAEGKVPPCWWSGLLTRLEVRDGTIASVEAFGCVQTRTGVDWHVETVSGEKHDMMAKRFERLCTICADPARVAELWNCFCQRNGTRYLSLLRSSSSGLPGNLTTLAKRAIRNKLPLYPLVVAAEGLNRLARSRKSSAADLNLLRNLLTCPAHHEAITTALEIHRSGTSPSAEAWRLFDELMAA